MLTHLQIRNFIIIDTAELNFSKGLSVITGETGAGKSIVIDALTLLLGGRAESNFVGPFHDKCDISACFDIEEVPGAIEWLKQQEYGEEPWNECVVRRILLKDGKSRQTINGYNCTVQQLKEFLPLLLNIHSQNQQQLLIKKHYQRELLDRFNNEPDLVTQVKDCYDAWLENKKQLAQLEQLQHNAEVQQELLEFQIQEFEKLSLLPGEYEQLDQEHKQLANADEIIAHCQNTLLYLSEQEDQNAAKLIYQAQHHLANIELHHDKLRSANELLNNSILHLEEALSELRAFTSKIEVNPQRLQTIEQRLSKIHELARKYQTSPQQLNAVHNTLKQQLETLHDASTQYQILTAKAEDLLHDYEIVAEKLHLTRQRAAKLLDQQITDHIQQLGMPGGIFEVRLRQTEEISPHGVDDIEFLVATNPGQSPLALSKVASGGEISRLALAIYVATAQKKTIPMLVFDEVDVGIGGGTAAIVGRLLKSLSQTAQVLCITHLPQVAAFGEHHYCVKKEIKAQQTATQILTLAEQERIAEIARMLGGLTITDKTMAHARELMNAD